MHWHYQVERYGEVTEEKEGDMAVEGDPFDYLDRMSKEHAALGGAVAHVSSTVSRTLPYGEIKCSFTVSISCPQNQTLIRYASDTAFTHAVQAVNRGMSNLVPGLPELPLK